MALTGGLWPPVSFCTGTTEQESIGFPSPILRQWNSIAIPLFGDMPGKGDTETEQFSITLPNDAVEMIENGLIPFGLYGKKRATVAAQLILDMLKTSTVQEQIRVGRGKASA